MTHAPAGNETDEPDEPLVAAADPSVEVAELAEHAHEARAVLLGTFFCLVSAVLYTGTNACLRSVVKYDPFWVSCLKALPTMLIAGVILTADAVRGRPHSLSLRLALGLLLTGLLAHFGGNVAFQWGLEYVGLAATVPITFSSLLVTGALLSRFWLGESITARTVTAIGLLTGAFLCVSQHTRQAVLQAQHVVENRLAYVMLAILVVCFSGIAYAVLGAVMRRTVTGAASVSTALFMIGLSGVACLGPAAAYREGLGGLAATPPRDLAVMLAAGTLNAVAFFALTRAMQLVPVSFVNIVNASQVAMAAVAGVVVFDEPTSPWLYGGIVLTVAGLVANRRPAKRR